MQQEPPARSVQIRSDPADSLQKAVHYVVVELFINSLAWRAEIRMEWRLSLGSLSSDWRPLLNRECHRTHCYEPDSHSDMHSASFHTFLQQFFHI